MKRVAVKRVAVKRVAVKRVAVKQVAMNRLCRVLLVPLVLACAGCGMLFGDDGVFRDRSEDYKKAPEPPEVIVPEGLDRRALREIYVIPPVQDEVVPEGEFEVPRPAPLSTGEGSEVIRIQKLGDQSWALIGVPPGQVWPQVRSFLAAAGMQVARVDAKAGLMETNWLDIEGKPLDSRFRFRIDQGVQRGTSELHVLQMNRTATERVWPETSDEPEQADEMLRAVSQYLADSAESAPVSMIAEQGISASGKIALQEDGEGHTYISLALPFDRAWASLDQALEKSSFEVTDRDRSAGIYYARFIGAEEEDESGFFDWLWPDGEESPLAGETFLVAMTADGFKAVTIRISPQDSKLSLEKAEEQALLTLIKGNIN